MHDICPVYGRKQGLLLVTVTRFVRYMDEGQGTFVGHGRRKSLQEREEEEEETSGG